MKKSYNNKYLIFLLLVTLTLLVFYKSLFADFLNWDDDYYILNNNDIKELSFTNIYSFFTKTYMGHYHPFTMISYSINYSIGGLNAFGYHLVNIITHAFSGFLVFLISRQLDVKQIIALFISIIFLVHPMRVESVVWISERKDVLFVFFYLLAIYLYLSDFKREKIKLLLVFITFVFSVLSKATAVTLPLILILMDYLKGKSLNINKQLDKIPFFIVSLASGIIAVYFLKSEGNIYKADQVYSIINQASLFTFSYIYYIVKLIFPFSLEIMHFFPKEQGGFIPIEYYISIVLFVALLVFIYKNRSNKILIFSFLFYSISIFLMLQILPSGRVIVAERYSYLPHFALLIYLLPIISKVLKSNSRFFITMIVISAILVFLTNSESKKWQNGVELFTSHIESNTNSEIGLVNRGLANYYGFNSSKHPDYFQAKKDFEKAKHINYKNIEACFNLANCYINIGEIDKGEEELKSVIKIDSLYYKAYNNLGFIFAYKEMYDFAILNYNKAISINEKYPDPYFNKAIVNLNINNKAEACKNFKIASSLGHFSSKDYLKKYCGN